jgi:hypothetical protein
MESKLILHGEILGVRYFLKSSVHKHSCYFIVVLGLTKKQFTENLFLESVQIHVVRVF